MSWRSLVLATFCLLVFLLNVLIKVNLVFGKHHFLFSSHLEILLIDKFNCILYFLVYNVIGQVLQICFNWFYVMFISKMDLENVGKNLEKWIKIGLKPWKDLEFHFEKLLATLCNGNFDDVNKATVFRFPRVPAENVCRRH